MVPNIIDFQARQEQYKDLLKDAQKQRLINRQASKVKKNGPVTNWLGRELVKWGSRLEGDEPMSSTNLVG